MLKIIKTEILHDRNLVVFHLENSEKLVYTHIENERLNCGEMVYNGDANGNVLYEPVFSEKEFSDDITELLGFSKV